MSLASSIPLIDLQPLRRSPDGAETPEGKATIREMDAALREVGFLYVRNHGVEDSLQDRLLELSRRFFAQPETLKREIAMEKAGRAWRGYFPVGGELTSGRPDRKEGIYFGRELQASHPAVRAGWPLHGPNLWPSGEPFAEFRNTVLAYMERMTELGQLLMEAVALGLGLPRGYFRSRFTDEPTTLFRIFNYPRHIWTEEQDEWGVREHTDMGFLTILRQDDSGGLQVKARDGSWIAAPPVRGTFVINIGDMLELWTHGIYRATPHRVRNQGAGDRLSLPFFFDPNWNSTLEPIAASALRHPVPAESEQSAQARWDGLDLKQLSGRVTYGEFVWAKVSRVFPTLAASPPPP